MEVGGGLIILWQFRYRLPQSREQQALRLIALSFFALAGYVANRRGRLQGRPAGVGRRGLLLLTSEKGLTSTSSAHGLVPRPTNPVTTSTEETQQ